MRHKANSLFESTDLQVFLFDHCLLFTKVKHENHLEGYRVFRKVSFFFFFIQQQFTHKNL